MEMEIDAVERPQAIKIYFVYVCESTELEFRSLRLRRTEKLESNVRGKRIAKNTTYSKPEKRAIDWNVNDIWYSLKICIQFFFSWNQITHGASSLTRFLSAILRIWKWYSLFWHMQKPKQTTCTNQTSLFFIEWTSVHYIQCQSNKCTTRSTTKTIKATTIKVAATCCTAAAAVAVTATAEKTEIACKI